MRACLLLPLVLLGGCPEDDSETITPDAPPECRVDCSPDGTPAAPPDAGADAAPAADDLFGATLEWAALPDDLVAAALAPVTDGEDGTAYVATTGDAFPPAPAVESAPGREATITLRWGTLPPQSPTSTTWLDYSGHVAVSKGTIELVRALSWEGAGDAASAPPTADFVATQTDPRVIRFRSWVRAGSDGLTLRIVKPILEPVVVDVKIGPVRRQMALEEFLAVRASSGGWAVPGNVGWESAVAEKTAGCYLDVGRLEDGTVTYDAQVKTAVDGFAAMLARGDGSREALQLNGGSELRGPYGLLSGTLGDRRFEGYFGRYYGLGDYEDHGALFGRLIAPDQSYEIVAGVYDRRAILGASVFRRVPCGTPGATQRNNFKF